MTEIAIVGMACRYPDARNPTELWENVLAQRSAFRRIPAERLRGEDYLSADRAAADRTYAVEAAVIEGYEFDRVRFRIGGDSFRSADLTHWLALDVAAQALEDAGFPDGVGLPRATTGVLLGNTLTGEFSRANSLRLRWPYVRRVVGAALAEEGRPAAERAAFLGGLESAYKAPFPPVGEETLAGGLSNTIAGRICGHFDLRGGGYTVDGACASSLLAVASACSALVAGDLDVVLAGGVDLSIDPFEVVGFAKAGALASDRMQVYSQRSAGFWPGEGCGIVVLMRRDDAAAIGRRVHALVRGWGVSSDGAGAITRPAVDGQMLALDRAYRRAGWGIDTVTYFEGHGTGTEVGDATELSALSRARQVAGAAGRSAAIGSVKVLIGHTKAAAGVAGLIKAAAALERQVLPPTAGTDGRHPELMAPTATLAAPLEGQLWPAGAPLRAGVSAMGFGGVNAHVVLESAATERRPALDPTEQRLLRSAQDAELFLLAADHRDDLRRQVDRLRLLAGRLSRSELVDLSAALVRRLRDRRVRAAIVASEPDHLAAGLERLSTWLADGVDACLDPGRGVFLGREPGRIGFMFPGQASPSYRDGGALGRRFAGGRSPYEGLRLPAGDAAATEVAQPAIVTSSLAGLRVLGSLGLEASVAVGHSLGELTALHWAGALDEATLQRIALVRGRAMGAIAAHAGAMASVGAGADAVGSLLEAGAVVASLNAPDQTVVAGSAAAVAAVVARARARGLAAVRLPVSHAFHSPLVAPALPALVAQLADETLRAPCRAVVSTVTGAPIGPDADLRELLVRQVTAPVRFVEAATTAFRGVDLLIEVGPGRVLSGLVTDFLGVPAVPLDAGGPSLRGLLLAVGGAFAVGAALEPDALVGDRFTRPFDLDWRPRFFGNPCELAPLADGDGCPAADDAPEAADGTASPTPEAAPLDLVGRLVAERTELPISAIRPSDRLLSDLHLSSIAVGQLVAEAARRLGLPPPVAPTDYADATVAAVAAALADLARTGGRDGDARLGPPPGIATWVRAFTVELVERPRPRAPRPVPGAGRVIAPLDHPLAPSLSQAFGGRAVVVVCLPSGPGEDDVELLLEGAQAAAQANGAARFVLVQHGGGAGSFAKTLHLEHPEIDVCVVDVPFDHPDACAWVVAEADAAAGYSEAHYDRAGTRRQPVLRLAPLFPPEPGPLPLDRQDVLLVTGGGKGIAADCALALAREAGCALALLGRSDPASDRELAANLERMAAAGVSVRYARADVGDRLLVCSAVQQLTTALGPITAFMHGAGGNEPQLLRAIDVASVQRTLAPKVRGARNVLSALDPSRLRLCVAFGSVIARSGMRGEADYALANEWLSGVLERWQAEHPHCRCITVEWSVWSGIGMGERLGRVDALAREGTSAIPPEAGSAALRHLLGSPPPATSVVVAGRLGAVPTLEFDRADLPFLRFLERPRVHCPGVELVAEADLSVDADPYLADHVIDGERVLPAVMGLEAMAQAATALVDAAAPPVFDDVRFDRPVVVPAEATRTIRLAALVTTPGVVEVALRSEETGFQVDHFRATCRFGEAGPTSTAPVHCAATSTPPTVLAQPERDLYGGILFHGQRFRRLRGYSLLRATECCAEVAPGELSAWFGRYLPPALLLGDPAARDAAIHAVQACLPHRRLLPIAVDRLVPCASAAQGPWQVHACERAQDGDTFVYDLEVRDGAGHSRERWEGLRLRAVSRHEPPRAWSDPLLGPYLERRLAELIPGAAVSVAVERSATRRSRGNRAIERALGGPTTIRRRPNGKPEVDGGRAVSCAHSGDLCVGVAADGCVSCDVEAVRARPRRVWLDLLGPERLMLAEVLGREAGDDLDAAATRAWAAGECLQKVGAPPGGPLILRASTADGWVLLSSGRHRVATLVASVRGDAARLAVAILVGDQDAGV